MPNNVELENNLRQLAIRIENQSAQIQTEEATKSALVMPFINALGYDPFNPSEVVPEYTADVGIKKGEKVDYAIKKDGEPIILIECKAFGADLAKEHASQLFRYFAVSESRIAILTNGAQYRFYSDIEQDNKMDAHPFFEFDIMGFDAHHIRELAKFAKNEFELGGILSSASNLKYTRAIKKILAEELDNPTEQFVRYFISRIYSGRVTQAVLEQFIDLVKEARKQFINEHVNKRLKSALTHDQPNIIVTDTGDVEDSEEDDGGVVTTVEEIEGYNIVKAILREVVDPNRIIMRDTKSYCGILLDDNNRKPLCRLHFNYSQKYIGIFDKEKIETRQPIATLNDIFQYAEHLLETVHFYD